MFQRVLFCTLVLSFCSVEKGNAGEKKPVFDIKTLEGLGYTSEAVDFFSKGSRFLPGVHNVKIQINAGRTYNVDARFNTEGELCVDRALLATLKLQQNTLASDCEKLTTLWPDAVVHAYPGQFRIELMLPERAFDTEQDDYQHGGHALLMNYNLFGQKIDSYNNKIYLAQGVIEPGLNVGNWVVRNRSNINSGISGDHYFSEETSALHTVESIKSVVQFGQYGNRSETFSGLPVVGVQLYSDNAQTNNSQLLVPIQGVADTNATVEVSQRGRVIYRTIVAPGPFALSNITNFSSNVPAELDIIEEDGRRQHVTVTNTLDMGTYSGTNNYQVGFGQYRQLYGSSPSSAAPFLTTGEVTFSTDESYRVTAGGLLSADYQNLVLKNMNSGQKNSWISTSVHYSHAQEGKQGGQLEVQGHLPLNGNFSTSLSTLQRIENFITPDEAFSGTTWDSSVRNATNASMSWASPSIGAFAYTASYNQYSHHGGSAITHNLSYAKSVGNAMLNLNLQTTSEGSSTAYTSLSLPLGPGTMNTQMQQRNHNMTTGATYRSKWRNNDSYSIGVTNDGHQQRVSGTGNMSTPYAQVGSSVSRGTNDNQSVSLSANGAIAYANGNLVTSSQPIGDTFAILSVPEQSNLRVQSPGSSATQTNYAGNAVLAKLPPYTKATAMVDTKTLPLNMRLSSTTADFELARGTVASHKLSVTETRQLLLYVHDKKGKSLPIGASVLDSDGQFITTLVGDGNAMLTNDDIGKHLRIKMPNQNECVVDYQAPSRFDPNVLYETADAVCY